MEYMIFGHTVEIESFEKKMGSVFEVKASGSIEEIGLPRQFLFQAPDKISTEVSEYGLLPEGQNTPEQGILADFLLRSIVHGELVEQFSFDGLNFPWARFYRTN
ncbi:hypothetical protein [Dinghuibacter silviterrae]|uniref:Uncharacterized protein n=1 Tax=Dinghuibacter silviterrae TaxID=1539049 RepID=A0A4R8DQY5_9BACT|nr:hypothetical protein [Dinghuibacter silviterrae]TDW99736.1 hypothetical protein EDB95_0747 [Dinghuibacter silviterrae]